MIQNVLAGQLMKLVPQEGTFTPVEGLQLNRYSSPTGLYHSVFFPAFCVIAQGRKEVLLGDQLYWYDPAHYLIATDGLPISSRVTVASVDSPYLSIIVTLDPALVASVMVESGNANQLNRSLVAGINVSPLDDGLLDATFRLVKLLESPGELSYIRPLITREIIFRLLMGKQRDRLSHIASLGSNAQRITLAINQLRQEYHLPLRVEELAKEAGMSVSGFHHHFKTVTAMSPVQFQKQLRLQEARKLMLGEGLDAADAGYRVGYNDPSHFNREYKRLFGEPPKRDLKRQRQTVDLSVAGAYAS
jgi:AraC-like DNA-binding protein